MSPKDSFQFLQFINLARRYWRDHDIDMLDGTIDIMVQQYPNFSRDLIREMVFVSRQPEKLPL